MFFFLKKKIPIPLQIFCVTFTFLLLRKWTTHTPGIMLDAQKTRWIWTWSPLQIPSNLVREMVMYTNNYKQRHVGRNTGGKWSILLKRAASFVTPKPSLLVCSYTECCEDRMGHHMWTHFPVFLIWSHLNCSVGQIVNRQRGDRTIHISYFTTFH